MASPSRSPSPLFPRPRLQFLLLLLAAAACLFCPTARAATPTAAADYIPLETLLVDNSVPLLINGKWEWVAEDSPLLRRREPADNRGDEEEEDDDDDKDDDFRSTATPSPTRRKGDDEEATSTVTVKPKKTDEDGEEQLQSITSTTTTMTQSPLPSAFDNNIDFNFTSNGGKSCPRFLNNLLMSDTFKKCYPISMMLQVRLSSPSTPLQPPLRHPISH